MLRFRVFSEGRLAEKVDLSGVYLVGSDGVPVRAEIEFKNGEIICKKRVTGPVGLAITWPVREFGRIMLETTRLPERDRPYVLQIELARSRMMRLTHKLEDWELGDAETGEALTKRVHQCRDLLIESLQADDEAEAAEFAERSLALGTQVAEELSLRYAGNSLEQRRTARAFPKRVFGCRIDVQAAADEYRRCLADHFDFVSVPICWRQIEPEEQKFHWEALDTWVEWLGKNRIQIRGTGLVDFSERNVPDWLYIWEHDFETIRDLVYEHIRRVVNRYGQYIGGWDVASGLHATNCVSFNFEQLMELTRMAGAVTRQLLPRATTVIDLVAPWGEYYAKNQRTIPPLLYADMAIQSGINFDAFGVQIYFGVGQDGMYVRDLFQVSALLDRFAVRGKPLHVTGVQVPSGMTADEHDAWGGKIATADGGCWRGEWTEPRQAEWLRGFYEIALSKPFVETVTWRDLTDAGGHFLPHGGLLRSDMTAKPSFEQLLEVRRLVMGDGG